MSDLINNLGGTVGFGENILNRNDDNSTGFIDVTSVFESGLNFFGTTYTGFYINNNGNITFNNPISTYTPFALTGNTGIPIIAPFFTDIDTRAGNVTASSGGNSTGSNLVYWDLDTENDVVTITWDDVGQYSFGTTPNAFQIRLQDLGDGNFTIEFRYEDIQWYGGNARAGYSAANGTNFFELPQSGTSSMLDLETGGNTSNSGLFLFSIINGVPNQPPSDLTLSQASVDENSSNGTAIGTFSTSDPDAGDLHFYTLLDNAGGRFAINGNQLVVANGSLLDYETNPSYNIIVRTTDTGNLSIDRSFTINLNNLPEPDLRISSFTAPPSASLGETIAVSWTVTNEGDGDLVGSGYGSESEDGIYLSGDDIFDSSDIYLTQQTAPSFLAVGDSYNRTTNLSIASTNIGSRYLLFVTDVNKDAVESNESNNVRAVPLEVTAADLQVDSLVVPANATFGSPVNLSWTVSNAGNAATTRGWRDRFYLSDDNTLSGDDILIGTEVKDNAVPLAAGASYTKNATFNLPLNTTLSDGTYYILLRADADSQQLESNESNNNGSASLPIVIPPTPDLVVSSIAAPPTEFSGQRIQVSWTIDNQGTAAATGTWDDRLFISTNNIAGDGDDVFFGNFSFTGTLDAGESLTRNQEITLPIDWSSDRWFVVQTDANNQLYEHASENNNVTVSEQPIAITLSPFPNLQVSSITQPTTAFSSAQTEVRWTVTNNGTGATNASFWYDQVWLSQDDILDLQGDYYLGRTLNPSYLNPGESYSSSLIATLPRSIDGNWRFIIKADGNNQVFEYDVENDNVAASEPVEVELTPPPDLEVTRVTIAPTSPFSGQQVTLNWTVTNTGFGRTLPTEATWTDELWMVKNPDGSGESYSLGKFVRNGGLQAGQFYNASQTVNLPIGKWQEYFFVVKTDVGSQVYENAFEDNNTGFFDANTNDNIDTPTNVLLTPPPDLTVESVTAPVEARSGQSLTINYRIANQGATEIPTRTANWSDAFYLSTSSTLDTSTAIFLGSQTRNGVLEAGDFYSGTATFTLPNGINGQYYVFVVADSSNAVFEQDDVDPGTALANVGSTANTVNIASLPADLVVTNLTAPNSVDAGKTARISWSVLNQGIGDTIVTSWVDRLVASVNGILGDSDDRELGAFSRSAEALQPGVTYSRTEDVSIPFQLIGNYNLFLVSDTNGQVYEGVNENNNNSAAVPVTVNRQTPDLQVTTVSAPTAAVSGDSIALSWTVRNTGIGVTNADYWYDEVFLSSDQTIDSSDRLLGAIRRNGTLAAGAEYSVNTNLTLPTNLSGNYSILVRTDSESRFGLNDRILEISESNNTNAATPPLAITLNPVPDLNITSVDAVSSALSGQSISLTWSVSNTGVADTGNGSWFDAVYLSRDRVFDRNNGDIYLGAILHNGGLISGQSYTQTQSFDVPRGLSGPFYAFVLTDSQAVIDERSSESNNIGYDSGATELILPPPSDLIPLANSITLPSTGTPGNSLTINYTVQNQGSDAALGSWSDAFYLSTDNQWDINDVAIAQVVHSGDVPAGSSYTDSLNALLPGVIPGDYQVIVRSDIRDQVPETNENNNNAASVGTISVDFESLAVGGLVTGTLAKGQAVYYKIQATAGQALKLELDSQDNNGANELYVRYGAVPTRGQFERTADSLFLADPDLILPIAQDGTYYVLVYGNSVTGAPSYTLTATDIPFSITEVQADLIGNVGQATVKVQGARFEEGTTFELIDSQGNSIAQVKDLFKDSTLDFVTFDLQGKAAGTYSFKAIQPNGVTTILADAVTVQEGIGANISEAIDGPPRVWAGQKYPISINYGNSGDTDATAPLLIVRNRNSATGITPRYDSTEERDRVVQLYGIGEDIGLGQLRPGEAHSIPLYFTHLGAAGSNDARVTVEEISVDDLEKITPEDWETLKQSAKPDGIDAIQWDAFWSIVQPGIGETWGDYAQLISQLSQAYNSVGERLYDVQELFDRWYSDTDSSSFQFRPKPSISGQLIDKQTNTPASGVTLDFYQAVDEQTFASFRQIVTDEQGRFNISSLSPGTYQLVAPNGYSFIDPNTTGLQPSDTIYTFTISPESGVSNVQLSINSLSDPIFYADDEYNNLLQQLDVVDAEVDNVINNLNSVPNLRVLSASTSLDETPMLAAVNASSGPIVPAPGGGIVIPIPGLGKLELKETREEKLTCSSGEITDSFTGALKLNILPDPDNPSSPLIETSNQAKLSIKSKYGVNSDTCQYEYDKTKISVEAAQFIKSNDVLDTAIILVGAFFPEALPILLRIKGWLNRLENATGISVTGSIAGGVGIQGNLEVDKNDIVSGSVDLNLGFGGGFSISAGDLFKADVSLQITGTVSSTGKVSGKAKVGAVVKVGAFEGILEASAEQELRAGETPEGMTLPGISGLVETFLARRPSTPSLPPECDCDPPNDYNPPALRSSDPNDILGPDGFGPERWIGDNSPLDYTIRFENVATATAPAKQVVITQQLDPDLDSRSFRLGSFGWGGLAFQVPENRSFYSERLDLREQYGIYVDVSAFVDIATAEIRWEIKAIDPETGDIPSDPLKGFLPPNLIGGEGEGYVTYTVKTKNTIQTGDKIDAQARIIFDNNEPIDTPAIFNTIDTENPTSSVEQLPSTSNNPVFSVSWAGSDDPQGSGLAGYNVYVSKDDAPFEIWLDRTTLTESTYTGEPGHTYRFYSLAVDNVGNEQDATTATPTTISLIGSGILEFSNLSFSVAEDGTAISQVTIVRTNGSSGTVGATVNLSDGSATGGSQPFTADLDYDNSASEISFADGETSKVITIPINDDLVQEGDENINLSLSNPTGGASLGTQSTASLSIADNDETTFSPAILSFSSDNFSINEDGSAVAAVTVTRTGETIEEVSVTIDLTNGTATAGADYNSTPILVSFADGETSKTVTIPIVNDGSIEGNETVNLTLSNPTSNANLGSQNTAVLTIVDNDTSNGINITGSSGNDTLNGTTGNDTLDGAAGDDRLRGLAGNDTYIVNSSLDVVVEIIGNGVDTIVSSADFVLKAQIENLTLTGNINLNGTGNSLDNTIFGNEGNNLLQGLVGNDTLNGAGADDILLGGKGDDLLNGGDGADRFLFDTENAFRFNALGVDTIADLLQGTDKIALSKTTFKALNSPVDGSLQVSEFATIDTALANETSVAGARNAKIVYNTFTGDLFYNPNGAAAGLGTGGLFATLADKPALVADDFLIQA